MPHSVIITNNKYRNTEINGNEVCKSTKIINYNKKLCKCHPVHGQITASYTCSEMKWYQQKQEQCWKNNWLEFSKSAASTTKLGAQLQSMQAVRRLHVITRGVQLAKNDFHSFSVWFCKKLRFSVRFYKINRGFSFFGPVRPTIVSWRRRHLSFTPLRYDEI